MFVLILFYSCVLLYFYLLCIISGRHVCGTATMWPSWPIRLQQQTSDMACAVDAQAGMPLGWLTPNPGSVCEVENVLLGKVVGRCLERF